MPTVQNLLAFEDFDDTYRTQIADDDGESKTDESIHSYTPHVKDWQDTQRILWAIENSDVHRFAGVV